MKMRLYRVGRYSFGIPYDLYWIPLLASALIGIAYVGIVGWSFYELVFLAGMSAVVWVVLVAAATLAALAAWAKFSEWSNRREYERIIRGPRD